MDVDQDVPSKISYRPERSIFDGSKAASPPFAQDHGPPRAAGVLPPHQATAKHYVRKGIIHHEVRHRQQLLFSRLLDAVTLQRTQIVGVSGPFRNCSKISQIALGAALAHFLVEVALQIFRHAIVVEQRIPRRTRTRCSGWQQRDSQSDDLQKNSGPIMPEIRGQRGRSPTQEFR